MSTIDQMLDRLFHERSSRLQAKIQRQKSALRKLQDKRGVRVVDEDTLIFDNREWMPTDAFFAAREKFEREIEKWRVYAQDDVTMNRMHKSFYEMAERQLSTLPTVDYSKPYSTHYAFSVLVDEYRGMLAMGLGEKLQRAKREEVARG